MKAVEIKKKRSKERLTKNKSKKEKNNNKEKKRDSCFFVGVCGTSRQILVILPRDREKPIEIVRMPEAIQLDHLVCCTVAVII